MESPDAILGPRWDHEPTSRLRACRIRAGDTEVLCAATIGDRVPPHLRGKGTGWVTAEYSMLPRATAERSEREAVKGRLGGRTQLDLPA